ncbi:hypothetical protein Tco_1162329, partial [Tanacetum coccineum]
FSQLGRRIRGHSNSYSSGKKGIRDCSGYKGQELIS